MLRDRHGIVGLLAAVSCLSGNALAHHSVSAIYDPEVFMEIEGEIERVFWANPHIRIWIRDIEGETWEIESFGLRAEIMIGVTKEMFAEGDVIKAWGNPERRGEPSMNSQNFLLADGREILGRRNAVSHFATGRIIGRDAESVVAEAGVDRAQADADGIFRVWTRAAGGQQWSVSRTPVAAAAVAQWDPLTDDPRLRCEAPGMVDAMASGYPIQLIQDGNDIVVRMEEWDAMRVIHMNPPAGESNIAPTPMGYSVGQWDENTLIVSTQAISWPYIDNQGTPQSPDVEIEEQFILSDDGTHMSWLATITDPVNLTEPATVRQEYEWVPGERLQVFNCQLPE